MNISVPPPLGLGRPSRQSIQYRLVVVQQPTRARCCGFGEKDKRPINPPPILQLHITNSDGSLTPVSETDNVSHLIAQCDLFSADRKDNRNVVYNPASINPAYPNSNAAVMSFQDPKPIRNFLGTLVSNAHQLMDLQDRMGIFFIFHDVSVRTEGNFCLRFRFIDLSAGEPLTMSTQVLHEVFSDSFSVYSAKNFPGMTGTTPLSLCFSKQGIKISVRKGPGTKRTSDNIYGESSGSSSPIPGSTTTAASYSSSSTSAQNSVSHKMSVQQQQQEQDEINKHQQSVTALTTFVTSGTQRTGGKGGISKGNTSNNQMEELEETAFTIESRKQEAMKNKTSSTNTTNAISSAVENSFTSSSCSRPLSYHGNATPIPSTTNTTQYTKIHISSVLASDDDDDNSGDNSGPGWPQHQQYPWQ
ncbi:hypothetical protein INT45_008329 [Circinella minor]|uniref:Velvet domain-containing protein n=1 Tax=Circinella minor TaxID=1195481 RepID=A0A8H7RXK8_9FUNG|nr:hypothetical protein INT45_008329 [Circinella minor]